MTESLTDREHWQLQHGRPVPARITWALDLRGLEGPQVDEHLGTFEGNPAGDVDDWEAARAVPRPEQVLLLAKLTRFPVGFFYLPVQPGPVLGGPAWICWGRGGGRPRGAPRGCEQIPDDLVDERGVLLRGGQEPAEPVDVQLGLFAAGGDAGRPAAPAPARPARTRERRPTVPVAQEPALLPRTRMSDADRALVAEAAQRARENRARRD